MFTRRFALLTGTLLLLSMTVFGDQNTPTAICNDNRTPAGILAHGVLQIHLEARQAVWYPNGSDAAHLVVSAFGEVGHAPQIPGPLDIFLLVPTSTMQVFAVSSRLLDRRSPSHDTRRYRNRRYRDCARH